MRITFLALTLLAGCSTALAQATFVDRYTWSINDDGFGGISGIEVAENGRDFVTISDRSDLRRGVIERAGGEITGVRITETLRLKRTNGRAIGSVNSDSEGLAISPDGTIYVAFEGPARVLAYTDLRGAADQLPRHPDFRNMQSNSALETLAIDAQGNLYTMPERSGRAERPFPVYRFNGASWSVAFDLPRRGAFLPVGLDFGPDGFLYLLERDFTGIGFRSRVRRFDPDGGSEQTLLQTGTGQFDNLEGLSVWRDRRGDIRLTMVSDDNFRFFQRTEIVEFRLTD